MDTIESSLQQIVYSIQHNFLFLLMIIGIVLGVQTFNWLLKYRLNILGIYPRKLFGLIGIPFSPILHGSLNHLIFNLLPFFILANFVLIDGRQIFFAVSLFIIVIAGLLIWLFGRQGFHVGASSLIMGYFGYLLFIAYHHPTFTAILIAFVCIYYLGGMFLNLFPSEARTSWEGHVFGFLAGIAAAYYLPIIVKFI